MMVEVKDRCRQQNIGAGIHRLVKMFSLPAPEATNCARTALRARAAAADRIQSGRHPQIYWWENDRHTGIFQTTRPFNHIRSGSGSPPSIHTS